MAEAERNLNPGQKPRFADKKALKQIMLEQNRSMGLVLDPLADIFSLRQKMYDLGIRADDNEFSRAIVDARED